MDIHKVVLSVWIYIIAYLSAVYAVSCTCGNIEENKTVNCECSTPNNVDLFYNDSKISGCYSILADCLPATWMGTSFTYTSTVIKISISNFKLKDCKMYSCKDTGTSEVDQFPYCPVLTMAKPDNDSPIDIVENTTAEFICKIRSGSPAGTVQWYSDSGTPSDVDDDVEITRDITVSSAQSPTDNQTHITTSTLMLSPSRSYIGNRIYCKGTNKPEQTPLTSQRKPLLNIIYYSAGPSIEEGTSYRVIENMSGQLSCFVAGGNPLPTLNWNCNGGTQTNTSNGNRITSTVTWTAHRDDKDTCICESTQTGLESRTATTQVTVLYPPSSPYFTVDGQQVAGNIMFIENRSQQIKCESIGNPNPTTDWEKRVGSSAISNGQFLNFTKILKTDAGLYTCTASNVMDPTGRHPLPGTNTLYTEIVILYPPAVDKLDNISWIKGSKLQVNCNVTEGFPAETTTTWKRDTDSRTWENKPLYIAAITKADTGRYTCTASNTMRPSGDTQSYPGTDEKHFDLTVLYEASVTSFYVDGFKGNGDVTVNESMLVLFKCAADSIPTANITMKHQSDSLLSNTSNTLNFPLPKASCLDAGTYSCSARNVYNQEVSLKTVNLFVSCIPRSANIVNLNRTSETNETFTFTFNAIAYPVPAFIWKKWDDDGWRKVQNDTNVYITSSDLQSNLTIRRVDQGDFGKYLLVVRNDIGELELPYQLEPHVEPDAPTNFVHIEHLATESSIQLEWKPGFNGGPPQTFYIKYKKGPSHTWTFVSVPDNGEQTMRYMLNGLESDTQYQLIIYSSNRKGNSSESELLIAKTKGNIKSNPAPMIGGVVGGLVIVAVIVVVIIVMVRRYKIRKGIPNSGAETTTRNRYETSKSSDDASYYNIGREVQVASQSTSEPTYHNDGSIPDYEMLNQQNRDFTTYSSLQPNSSSLTNDNSSGENKTYENLQLGVM